MLQNYKWAVTLAQLLFILATMQVDIHSTAGEELSLFKLFKESYSSYKIFLVLHAISVISSCIMYKATW